jgi:hypothetical protein
MSNEQDIYACGCGVNQIPVHGVSERPVGCKIRYSIPIFVTIPRLLCKNMPSGEGPKLNFDR